MGLLPNRVTGSAPADARPLAAMADDAGDLARLDAVAVATMNRIQPALVAMKANVPGIRAALTSALHKTPKLARCEPSTIDAAVLRGATLGLALGDEWYLVPRSIWNKESRRKDDRAEFQLGYKGEVTLGWRTGLVRAIRFGYVHEKDRVVRYDEPAGVLTLDADPLVDGGQVVGYWCVVDLTTGATIVKLTGRHVAEAQAEAARLQSYDKTMPATWRDHFDAMALRHPIKQALKPLPRSSDYYLATAPDYQDDSQEQAPVEASVAKATAAPVVEQPTDHDPETGEVIEVKAAAQPPKTEAKTETQPKPEAPPEPEKDTSGPATDAQRDRIMNGSNLLGDGAFSKAIAASCGAGKIEELWRDITAAQADKVIAHLMAAYKAKKEGGAATQPKAEAKPKAEPKTEPSVEPKAEPVPKVKPKAEAKVEAAPKEEPKAEVPAETEPQQPDFFDTELTEEFDGYKAMYSQHEAGKAMWAEFVAKHAHPSEPSAMRSIIADAAAHMDEYNERMRAQQQG